MSYALSGSTPVPVPTTNTPEVLGLSIGVMRLGVGYGMTPWLDANLVVRNVTPAQANAARDIARSVLTTSGATVDDVRWVAGGFLHARWQPTAERPAVEYATQVRDALLRASVELSPRSQIIMVRYRIDMPALRDDIYVYPVGPVPPPPPAPAGAPPDTVGVTPPSLLSSPAIMGTAAVIAVGLIGAAIYVSRAPRVRKNRNRRRRSR